MPQSFAARQARAQARGLQSYHYERKMRARAKALGLDPNIRYPGLVPAEDAPRRRGLQGPSGPSPSPDWDYYWPTRTGRPQRKYTQMARYSRQYQCLEVVFRDGTPWHWTSIDEDWWTAFKQWNTERPTYDFLRGQNAPLPAVKGVGRKGGWGTVVGETCM
jgi:hypothetical protein